MDDGCGAAVLGMHGNTCKMQDATMCVTLTQHAITECNFEHHQLSPIHGARSVRFC